MKHINLNETNLRAICSAIQNLQAIFDTNQGGSTVIRTNRGTDAIVIAPDVSGQMLTVGDGVQIGNPLGGDMGTSTLNIEGQIYIDGDPITPPPDAAFLTNIVEDLTPQLGGDLDLNGHQILGLSQGTGLAALIDDPAPTLGADLNLNGHTIIGLTTGGLANIVEDLTPQLGGNLDLNGLGIGTATNAQALRIGPLDPAGAYSFVHDCGTAFGSLMVQSASTGTIGPFFRTYATKAGANDDTLGGLSCWGKNTAGTAFPYAAIGFKIQNAAVGQETSSFYLDLLSNGQWLNGFTIDSLGARMQRGSSAVPLTDNTHGFQVYKYNIGTGYRNAAIYSEYNQYGSSTTEYGQGVWGVAYNRSTGVGSFAEGGRFHGVATNGGDSMGVIAFAQSTKANADVLVAGVEAEVRTAGPNAPDPTSNAPGPLVVNFIASCREGSAKPDMCFHCNQSNTTPARMGFTIGQNSVDHTGFINWANLVYGLDLAYGAYSSSCIRVKNNRPGVSGRNGANGADVEMLSINANDDTAIANTAYFKSGSGVFVGNPTGYYKGAGTINCSGDIYKNNSAYGNPDYALEHYFTGKIEQFKDNEGASTYRGLVPLEELETRLREDFRLPNMTRTEGGVGIFERADLVLEKLEEAYLYIIELHKRMETYERPQ